MIEIYKVKSDVYSMDFFVMRDEIKWENISIKLSYDRKKYREIRNKIRDEKRHYKTGDLEIFIPENIDRDKIKEYYNKIVNRLHALLVFIHGHDIPIVRYQLYRLDDGNEVLIEDSISSIHVGKPGSGSSNIYYGINKCVNQCIPLLLDDDFVEKTDILSAMYMYNSSLDHSLLETTFLLIWLGIESLANCYYENNETDLLISRDEWNEIKDYLKGYLKGISKEDIYDKLINRISFLRSGTIKEKIDYMLNSTDYKFGMYSEEMRFIYDKMRVPLFHGRQIDWNANFNPIEKVFRTKKLLEKLIFKTLDFYDNDMIHYAIRADDLSAR